jgi:protein gp37
MIAHNSGLHWAIIGAMSGPGAVKPKPEWVQGLIDQYRVAGVPLFLKDNLNYPERVREWPE